MRSLDKSISLPDAGKIIALLIERVLSSEFEGSDLDVICEAFASILNKTSDDTLISTFLNETAEKLFSEVQSAPSATPRVVQSILILAWTVKAFAMRSHPKSVPLWNRFQGLLKSACEPVALHVAAAFEILFRDASGLTSVRLVYKQKFFTLNLPDLITNVKVVSASFLTRRTKSSLDPLSSFSRQRT